MPTTYEIVRDAIQTKKIVAATYHGYERVMCPHVLGTKRGREQGLFYQFAAFVPLTWWDNTPRYSYNWHEEAEVESVPGQGLVNHAQNIQVGYHERRVGSVAFSRPYKLAAVPRTQLYEFPGPNIGAAVLRT